MCSTGEEEAGRDGLIEAMEALLSGCNPRLTDTIFETLQSLGALDDSEREHMVVVRQQVQNCLSGTTDSEKEAESWSIYTAQFNHPYAGAYSEVMSELTDRDRKTLLARAARGVTETRLWLTPLLVDLAAFGDRDAGDSIARWTALPAQDNRIMPGDDMDVFVVAHIALARLGCPLPEKRTVGENPSAKALAACGVILYWSNRTDLREGKRLEACSPALDALTERGKDAALDVIRECQYAGRKGAQHLPGDVPVVPSIVGQFPSETTAICRDALLDPASQVGYFSHFSESNRHQNVAFAIDVLKVFGNNTDCSVLRRYASDRNHGKSAIVALRAIEERLLKKSRKEA